MSFDLEEAINCVRLVETFNTLPEQDVLTLAYLVHERTVPDGTWLYTEGSKTAELLIVAHGQIKINKGVASGREQLIRILGPGDFDGEALLFSNAEHKTSAQTVGETTLCTIDRGDFQSLLADSPQLALNIMNALGHRLAKLEAKLTATTVGTLEEQLADYLLETSASLNQTRFTLPLAKKDLAAFLGTTPETLSRKLKQLTMDELIALHGRREIEILDSDGLAMLS